MGGLDSEGAAACKVPAARRLSGDGPTSCGLETRYRLFFTAPYSCLALSLPPGPRFALTLLSGIPSPPKRFQISFASS